MSDMNSRGFAGPVDRVTYGPYVSNPQAGEHSLKDYAARLRFTDRISTDGSTPFAAEAGRYHVYLQIGCPWAQRVAIAIRLQGLSDVISTSLVDDVRDGRGWAFREGRGRDPINDFSFLKQAYLASDPNFFGHINVPTLWDRKAGRVANNDDFDIFWDVVTKFGALATQPIDLYPAALRPAIDALDAEIHENVNFGVYSAAIATNQKDHDERVARVFATLDRLEEQLADRRYLFGDAITETDIRLWVSLARFDGVYNAFFKVNLKRLVDYPNLWAYARDLYREPAFAELTDFHTFKLTYYLAFPQWNPAGIVPIGPLVDWSAPAAAGPVA